MSIHFVIWHEIVWFRLAWFYGISTIIVYLMPNPFLYNKTVLFQTIQFSISILFSTIWPIDSIQSGATTAGESEHWWDGNKGVLCILQSSSITVSSPSDYFVSHPGLNVVVGLFFSAEMQSVYSIGLADWARRTIVPYN